MKKAVKLLSLLLALIMVIGVLSGCGGNKQSREKGKYSYWSVVDSRAQQTLSKLDDMLMYQELAKKTGMEIEFIHPTAGSTGSEAFQILLTSANMPDMVEYSWKAYPGGADAAIDNKVIISLNDYLEEYAPDYYDYMEGERGKANGSLYKAQAMTQKGNYYGFCSLKIGTYRGFGGLYTRKDLLDKWGLDIPVTIDDWTEVLKTAKANGIKYPLTGSKTLFSVDGGPIFDTAWEVGRQFHMEGNKIIFSVEKPGYKDYVKTMADWFKKGYIDPDYITNDSDAVLGKITNSNSIVAYGYVGGGLGKIIPAMEGNEKTPDFQVVACPYPVLEEGKIPWFQEVSPEAADPTLAITVSCGKDDADRYKEAISWANNFYTEEGKILKSFGVEGKTFTKSEKKADEIGPDGEKYKYTYTSVIVDDNDPGREDIGAHSVEAALYHFMRPGDGPGLSQHPDYLDGFYPYQEQKDAIVIWNEHIETAKQHVVPPFSLTDAETTRRNELRAKVYDTLDAAVSNIIMGKADISTFDGAVAKAKADGYDEITAIYQTAVDRYYKTISK